MQLTIHEVAAVMQVSERTVRRWIKVDGLPTHDISGQTYIHRLAFFEWSLKHRIARSTAILGEHPLETWGHEPLARAIEEGEVIHGLAADDRESALRAVAERIRLPNGVHRRTLADLFLNKAFDGAMDMGEGIVVPHPRRPVILPVQAPSVTICHFRRPVELGIHGDGKARTLFVIASPTVRRHQLLLAHLCFVLWNDDFRAVVGDLSSRERLAQLVRQFSDRPKFARHDALPGASRSATSRAS